MRHLISFTAFPQEALEQDQEDTVAREESAHDEARVHASESGTNLHTANTNSKSDGLASILKRNVY